MLSFWVVSELHISRCCFWVILTVYWLVYTSGSILALCKEKGSNTYSYSSKGAYIKYVGGGAGRFCKFVFKKFVAKDTIDLNCSWPSKVFRKYFMAPPISFSFIFRA